MNLLLLFLLASSSAAAAAESSHGLLATVWRSSSGHYVTQLNLGSPPQSKPVLLDVSQNYIWVECATAAGAAFLPPSSSTFIPVVHRAEPVHVNISSTLRGQLVLDSLTFNSTDGINPGLHDVEVKRVRFLCTTPSSSSSTPQITSGVAGLGRGRLSLPSNLASLHNLPRRFAYCLSGSQFPTPLFLASSNYTFLPGVQVSNLLHTPLLRQTKQKPGYRVGLKSIGVGLTTLSINPKVFKGGLEVSTTEPYTKLVRPAYVVLRDAFRKAESGIRRVPAPAPFDTCFNATGLGSTRVGPPVNPITFTFEDNSTTWYFYGVNSMVFVSEDVMCLGFLDAGPSPSHSILGTFQQQDSLVEVDIDKSQLGFYSTLSFIRTGCAGFNFTRSNV